MKTHPLTGQPIPEPPTSEVGTYWNGLPTPAEQGTAIVAEAPEFPRYWAAAEGLIGSRIPVVRVVLDGVNYGGGVDYLDNRDGSGWRKVTEGHGGPGYPHASVAIVGGSWIPGGERSCSCGDPTTYSLNPAEVVVHSQDECRIGPAMPGPPNPPRDPRDRPVA